MEVDEKLILYVAHKATKGISALVCPGEPCKALTEKCGQCRHFEYAKNLTLAMCQYFAQNFTSKQLSALLDFLGWVQRGCDRDIGISRQIDEYLLLVIPNVFLEPFLRSRKVGVGISARATSANLYPAIKAVIRYTMQNYEQLSELKQEVTVVANDFFALPKDLASAVAPKFTYKP